MMAANDWFKDNCWAKISRTSGGIVAACIHFLVMACVLLMAWFV